MKIILKMFIIGLGIGALSNTFCLTASQSQERLPELNVPSKQDLLIKLRAYSIIFYKTVNLLTNRITTQEAADWNALLKTIQSYVQKNDPKLLTIYQKLEQISNQFINTLKIASGVWDPGNKQKSVEQIQKILDSFYASKPLETLRSIQSSLKPGFWTSQSSKNVREVLQDLSSILSNVIEKQIPSALKRLKEDAMKMDVSNF